MVLLLTPPPPGYTPLLLKTNELLEGNYELVNIFHCNQSTYLGGYRAG
jgi:hypothetical protein